MTSLSSGRPSAEPIRDTYTRLRPKYQQLASEVEFALKRRLEERHIEIASIASRAKAIDSVVQKISRKQYDDPMSEIPDFAGVRVVCLYDSDLPEIQRLIEQAFQVAEATDKMEVLGADRMGYQGRHFVVRLGPQFCGDRYEGLHDLHCEIQARTVLQDAWAQISHHLVYKTEAS